MSTLPAIWDRLSAAGLRGTYYYIDIPFTALWGSRYLSISQPFTSFIGDCATGNLPEVSLWTRASRTNRAETSMTTIRAPTSGMARRF